MGSTKFILFLLLFYATFGKGSRTLNMPAIGSESLPSNGPSVVFPKSFLDRLASPGNLPLILLMILHLFCIRAKGSAYSLVLLVLTLLWTPIPAYAAYSEFSVTVDPYISGYTRAISLTDDEGFFVAYTNYTSSNLTPVLAKYNSAGVRVWDRTHTCPDTSASAYFERVATTPDGGCIVLGSRAAGCVSGEPLAVFLTKYTSDGTNTWLTELSMSSCGLPLGLKNTSYGSYIATGECTSINFAASIALDGTKEWEYEFENSKDGFDMGISHQAGSVIIPVNDYSISDGYCQLMRASSDDWSVASPIVNKEFINMYDTTGIQYCYRILDLGNSYYALVGYHEPTSGGDRAGWLAKVNIDGTMLWQQTFDTSNTEELNFIEKFYDGTFMLVGTNATGSEKYVCYLNVDSTDGTLIEKTNLEDSDVNDLKGVLSLPTGKGIAVLWSSFVNGYESLNLKVKFLSPGLGCTAGNYFDTETSTCLPCPVGQYQDLDSQTNCTLCESGTYQNLTGQISCEVCPVGTYQLDSGQSECIPCDPGSYQNLTGQPFCELCPVGTYQQDSGQSDCIPCDPGYYQDSLGNTTCIECPVGTYQNLSGAWTCNDCLEGTYQGSEGKTVCYDCEIGTYQDLQGQSSCKECAAGKYQDTIGKTTCIDCDPGFYQSLTGQTECLSCPDGTYATSSGSTECISCDSDWYVSANRDQCLYKGIFTSEAEFNSHEFSSACFDSSEALIAPYPRTCRDAYHSICCSGSSLLPDVNCNHALETTTVHKLLYDNYCSACTFMDSTACPPDGLCWDNSLWTDNAVSPYPLNYSIACLESISEYCASKLADNVNDQECAPFVDNCFAAISESSYGESLYSFRISFTNKLPLTLPDCNTILETPTGISLDYLYCERSSDTSINFDISKLEQPIVNYTLASNVLKDACGINISTSTQQSVQPPTTQTETIAIGGFTNDKCLGLKITSTVQKSYLWPIKEQYWTVNYNDPSGIPTETINRLENIGNTNKTEITIEDYDLYPSKTLSIKSKVWNPYGGYTESNLMTVLVPQIASGKKYCGPCQLEDRSKCPQFNGVCWQDYRNHTITEPYDSPDCLRAMAPFCYSIWNSSNIDDPQCLDFKEHFNYTKMGIKPELSSAEYSSTGKAIILNFTHAIYREEFIDCSGVFNQVTLNWLPASRSCKWITSKTLEVEYDPQIGIMDEITIQTGVFYYDYVYAQESIDSKTLSLNKPPLKAAIEIKGVTTISECETLDLFAALITSTLYPLAFKWEIVYTPPLPEPLKSEAESYFEQYTQYSEANSISIPSRYLKSDTSVEVTLSGKAASFDSNVLKAETTVNVYGNIPKIKYTSKSQFIVELLGNQANRVPFQIDNGNCNSNGNLDQSAAAVEVSFSVSSGETAEKVETKEEEEQSIEKAINEEYSKYKALFVGVKQGFKYLKYYKITATAKSKDSGKTNSDTILIYLTKPPIKCVIDSPGSLVSMTNDVVLSGTRSELPATEDDVLEYSWKCLRASALEVGGKCECPIFAYSDLKGSTLRLQSYKLVNMCSYGFRLTISATYGKYKRTSYSETEFITLAGPAVQLKGKVLKGTNNKVNDMYFTFEMDENLPENGTNYSWSLTGVSSEDPKVKTKYSEKNTFIYDFFKNELKANVDPNIKKDDTPIDESNRRLLSDLQPQYLTPNAKRVLGIDKASLKPMHKYTFGVTVQSPKGPKFLFIDFSNPPAPRTRKFAITPTVGIGYQTQFTFTFTLPSSTDVDEAQYQIYRRNCPSTNSKETPLIQMLPKSNSYTATLAPGLKSCEHQVEVILKIFEYESSLEVRSIITVKEPGVPVQEALKSQLDRLKVNADLTVDQRLTVLAEVTNIEVTETTDSSTDNANSVYNQLDTIDQPDGILKEMETEDKSKLVNTVTGIMSSMVSRQKASVDVSLASSVGKKVDGYLDRVKEKEVDSQIIPTALEALSGVVDVGKEKKSKKELFEKTQNSMGKMKDIKMSETLPGAVQYQLSSDSIEMVVTKNYAADYNKPKKFTTGKGAVVSLPDGITDQMVNSVNTKTNNPLTFGASVYATKFNPFATLKSNTKINVDSLTSDSTQGHKPETVEKIYSDLAKGEHTNIVNTEEQSTDILQVSFKAYEFQQDATEKALNSTVNVGKLPEGKKATFSIPVTEKMSEHVNKTVMVPLYYLPDKKAWTNEDCSLDALDANSSFIGLHCKHLGVPELNTLEDGLYITVDLIKDVINVIRAGNYEQLIDVSVLMEGSTRNIVAYICIGIVLFLFITTEVLLFRKDRRELFDARLNCLFSLYDHEEIPMQTGTLYRVISFFSEVQKKGFNNLSKENQQKITPARPTTETVQKLNEKKKKPTIKKKANGYNILSEDEKQSLHDAYCLYKQCSMVYDDHELRTIMAKEFEKNAVLSRSTQIFLDESILYERASFWLLLKTEHPVLSAITRPEIRVPRPVKFLLLICVIVGELFMTGYFYDIESEESVSMSTSYYFGESLVYALASAILMIPLKITISLLLAGSVVTEDMTREEIEAAERKGMRFRVAGLVVGYIWVGICLYGIMMYIITFNTFALDNWMFTFATSLFTELVIIAQTKVALKILVGIMLLRLLRVKIMMTAIGILAGKIIDRIARIF